MYQSDLVIRIHTFILFQILYPYKVITEYWVEFPVLYRELLLKMYTVCCFGWRGLALESQEPVLWFSHRDFHKLHAASSSPWLPLGPWSVPDGSSQTLELIAPKPGLTAVPFPVVDSTQSWQPCMSLGRWARAALLSVKRVSSRTQGETS